MKINKGQFRLNSKQKIIQFELKRGKGHLVDYISNRIKWHLNPRLHKVSTFPSHVDIELSSLCNLNCPMCYTTTDEFKEKVDAGNFAELNVHPSGDYFFKLPEDLRNKIPTYIKENINLERFIDA